MSNVTSLHPLPHTIEETCDSAKGYEQVVIVGVRDDGVAEVIGSGALEIVEALGWLELGKAVLLDRASKG
jgi:hypothetical protein